MLSGSSIPFSPIRNTLYTAEELLEGFDPARPESFAETRDFRIYRFFLEHGGAIPTEPLASLLEALHDNSISRACVQHLLSAPRVAAIMGGHRMPRGSAAYRAVVAIARGLARQGFLLASGGGPGAMEATHLGALMHRAEVGEVEAAVAALAVEPVMPEAADKLIDEAGNIAWPIVRAMHRWQAPAVAVRRSVADPGQSLAVPTWYYGHEPFTPLASHVAKYFQNSIREDGLLALAADGIVYAEGSAGTVQEIFQDAAQNYYASVGRRSSPMVFFGAEYWTRTLPVRPLLETLLGPEGGSAKPGTRLLFTDSVDEAVAFLADRPDTGAQRDLMVERAAGTGLLPTASSHAAPAPAPYTVAAQAAPTIAAAVPASSALHPVPAAAARGPAAAVGASPTLAPGPIVRVATFNVENLAHPGADFFEREGDAPYTEAAYEDKIGWIGRILDEGRVDLVGFQELFSWRAVNEAVRRSMHLSTGGGSGSAAPLTVLAPGIQDGRNERRGEGGRLELEGPHVGLATRLPVLAHESVAGFPPGLDLRVPVGLHDEDRAEVRLPIARFERPVLKVRVLLPGEAPATVFVAHLKSKRPKYLEHEDKHDPIVQALGRMRSLVIRAAEAVALRALVGAVLEDAAGRRGEPVIVLGDLNDDLGAVTTQLVAGEEPPAGWPIEHKRHAWDTLLYSVHDLQDERSLRDVSYTHLYNGRYELLDHVFVSQELVRRYPDRVGEVRLTRIFNDHLFDSRLAAAEQADHHHHGTSRPLRQPGRRSDHGVPVTEIQMLLRAGGRGGTGPLR